MRSPGRRARQRASESPGIAQRAFRVDQAEGVVAGVEPIDRYNAFCLVDAERAARCTGLGSALARRQPGEPPHPDARLAVARLAQRSSGAGLERGSGAAAKRGNCAPGQNDHARISMRNHPTPPLTGITRNPMDARRGRRGRGGIGAERLEAAAPSAFPLRFAACSASKPNRLWSAYPLSPFGTVLSRPDNRLGRGCRAHAYYPCTTGRA